MTYTYARTHTYTHAHAHIQAYMHAHTHACMHTHTHTQPHTHINTHTHTHTPPHTPTDTCLFSMTVTLSTDSEIYHFQCSIQKCSALTLRSFRGLALTKVTSTTEPWLRKKEKKNGPSTKEQNK